MRGACAALAALGLMLGSAAGAAAQEPPELCGTHEVAPGETLGVIAQRVYGDAGAAELIFEANRDRLDSPDVIRPGQGLRLPCDAGGRAPRARPPTAQPPDASKAPEGSAVPEAPEPAPPPETLPPQDAPAAASAPAAEAMEALPVAVVGENAPALTQVREALGRAAPNRIAAFASGGVEALHPLGEALLAAPVPDPGCARLERLAPASAALCVRHDWSEPLARVPVVWLAHAGSELPFAEGPSALRGRRLCRPAGAPQGDLAAAGLLPPRVERLAPETAEACLRLVLSGAADAAALRAPEAARALARLGEAAEKLQEVPALSGRITLHAVSRKDSAEGRAALTLLDRGLNASEDSGEGSASAR